MSGTRAADLADQAWLRLSARAAMLVFSLVGSLGIPLFISYLAGFSTDLRAITTTISALQQEMRVAQARDDQRLQDITRRLEVLERRIERTRE